FRGQGELTFRKHAGRLLSRSGSRRLSTVLKYRARRRPAVTYRTGPLKSVFPAPEMWIVVQDHVQQRVMDFQVSVVLDKPKLAELVHEGAHPRPCGADHLREHLLAYLRYDRLRLPLLAEVRH